MLRGRIVRLNDVAGRGRQGAAGGAVGAQRRPRAVLFGDGAARARRSSRASGGRRTIRGEPLVSFEAELAGKLGLKIGDTVTVNVLGRNVTARIANLREVKWESLAINFVMVFSPNTLPGAPHNLLVTISLPNATPLGGRGAGDPRARPRLPGDHRHPREGRARRVQRGVRQGDDRRCAPPAA